jgi:hypothetical protein
MGAPSQPEVSLRFLLAHPAAIAATPIHAVPLRNSRLSVAVIILLNLFFVVFEFKLSIASASAPSVLIITWLRQLPQSLFLASEIRVISCTTLTF